MSTMSIAIVIVGVVVMLLMACAAPLAEYGRDPERALVSPRGPGSLGDQAPRLHKPAGSAHGPSFGSGPCSCRVAVPTAEVDQRLSHAA